MQKILLSIISVLFCGFVYPDSSLSTGKSIAESSFVVDVKPDNRTYDTLPIYRSQIGVPTFKAQAMDSAKEYGWVQDVVGIDENAFNYVDGSDPDLELLSLIHI